MAFKTDIQIADEATMFPIEEVAAKIGIEKDDLEQYGKYKTKISWEAIKKIDENNENGKLILVSAIRNYGSSLSFRKYRRLKK